MQTPAKSDEKRILCVGMCVLDIIHIVERFPVEDEDKRCLTGYWQRGGNASNNCTVLKNLGAECEYLGMTSQSKAFGFLLDDCRQRGIFIENCPSVLNDPPFSTVLLNQESGSRTIIHSNPNFPIFTHEHFRKLDLSQYKWVHFEGRNPNETLKMIESIKDYNKNNNANIKISMDIEKLRPEILVLAEGVDYVILGKDMAVFLGWPDAKTAVYELRDRLTVEPKPAVVCAWGNQGADCLDAEGNYAHCVPDVVDNVVDSLGAGDTFCAAIIYALSHEQPSLQQAVDFGNQVASFKLQHRGYDNIKDFKEQSKTDETAKCRCST